MLDRYLFENLQTGQALVGVTHHLDEDFVERFLRATGDDVGTLAPGSVPEGIQTLLSTAVFRAGTVGRSGDLHISHEYEQFAPMKVGQRTATIGYVTDLYIRGGRKYVVYDTLTTDTIDRRLHFRCRVTLAVTR
jgi:hypothetical protein